MASSAFVLAGVPRVNLMPPLEIERRKRASLVRGWGWAVFTSLVVAALVVGGAFALKLVADQALAVEQANTTVLLTELSSLSEVSGAIAAEGELTYFRADAMGSDFAWTPLVAAITGALPAEVRLTGFDLTSGGNAQTEDPTSDVGLIGTMTLDSPNPIDLPATIRQLRDLESVANVDGRALTTGGEGGSRYTYQLDVTFDQSIYSGQYAPVEGAQ
ncbi:hypothetical protein [Microbacterium sp. SS28]|uniref:hypothetical protein n=1 Tax=Microbacterium sp. SS28 TaxID=2919948 RepID=UPI001FAA78BE|nr:hypothetical protein [Microbacterium sp. SS28]